MHIRYHKTFDKRFLLLLPKLQFKVKETIKLFMSDPFGSTIRNHALKGKWLGCRSIDVTGDLRIIFRELSNGSYEIVELITVGTHSQLY